MRVRLVYEKRGGACFVPHIALAQMFARAALRAGFVPEMTQGFSPRARLSFAPELPAGVVALNEAVDMYFSISPKNNNNNTGNVLTQKNADAVNASITDNTGTDNTGNVSPQKNADTVNAAISDKNAAIVAVFPHDVFVEAMNAALPEGFRITRVLFPAEGSPSLGKSCKHAEYLIRHTNGLEFLGTAKNFYGAAVVKAESLGGWLRLILRDPAQNPIGGLIKHMISQNLITGWHEVNIVRKNIGIYDQQKDCVNLNA